MIRVTTKKKGRLMVRPTAKKAIARRNWVHIIHFRFVEMTSTKGLHRGFIVQGKYRILVQKAIIVFEIPIVLYITTETIMAIL
jgi:hypothetical protein